MAFRLIGPWSKPERVAPVQPIGPSNWILIGLAVLVFALAPILGWRNYRAGRGDIRGAGRLAAFAFCVELLEWLCTAHHVSRPRDEARLFLLAILWAMFMAGFLWTLYVAIEPHVRRHWPQSIISWSRLLNGGVRDPLVGAHVLVATAIGVSVACLMLAERILLAHYGSLSIFDNQLRFVLDARRMVGSSLSLLVGETSLAMATFLWLFLFRVLLRRQWLAVAAFLLLFVVASGLGSDHPVIAVSIGMIFAGSLMFAIRFGVLSLMAPLVSNILIGAPLSTDFSTWYAGSAVFALAIVLALTAYAFHTAVAGRPLFKT